GLMFNIMPSGSFTIVVTDGHRIAISSKSVDSRLKEEKKIIFSRKSLSELRKFLDDEAKPVRMAIGKNHILFEMDSIQYLARLIEGTYPNYEQVIPAAADKTIGIDRI